jgi:SAM-dependent methyltransferase
MIDRSTRREYFEQLYTADPDPFGYAISPYEKHKYAATIAGLPRARFRRAFEIGCSIGVLTRLLAARCDNLLAIDVSEAPLAAARLRCRDARDIRLRRMRVPDEWPGETFDLVVLSEVLYYQSARDQRRTVSKTLRTLRPNGVVVLVHWLGETGTARSGDEAANQFIRQARRRLRVVSRKRNSRYRLDILAR